MSDEANNPREPLSGFMIRYRTLLVVTAHGILFALALLAAFLFAYNFRWVVGREDYTYRWFLELYLPLVALALPTKLLLFHWTGQYRGSWRYVGLRDLFAVIRASLMGTFFFLLAYFVLENLWQYWFGERLIDRTPFVHLRQSSIFALDWAATIALVSAARVLVRFYYEDIQPKRVGNPSRVLIVGAGDAGEAVLRELLRTGRERYECVGFLDDDVPRLRGRIHGVELVGRTAEIREICNALEVQEVLIALPHATPKTIRLLVERCQGMGVRFRTIPAVTDVIEGRVQVSQIRDVDIADLLGREPVELDTDIIGRQLRGKRVVVTGAGGSIGSEMCRQIASFRPERLLLLERAENSLFEIDRELREKHPDLDIVPYVADVGDRPRLETIFEKQAPSIVFHAAAHKHVPMMEINPGEAIKNNIGGTVAVADVAMAAGVEKMVMISTDKAVNPTSVMGGTKRVAEMYVQSLTGRGVTQFVTVRFGNVLGSSGSVVPIFKTQIADGGPVTVTHPDMKRYFMTISEAAELVLQAGTMGKGGEIYVLHMGEPIKIVDLARDMITLSGLRPGIDIEIAVTSIRPGEKLFEELSSEGEHIGDTAHPKIGIWKHRPEDPQAVEQGVARLIGMADTSGDGELQAELSRLVPEYTPDVNQPEREALVQTTTPPSGSPARRS
ncbi:MAG: nucleoside-diphosphate sugar epimerase/dehydratase [Phycisphaerae bacterium]